MAWTESFLLPSLFAICGLVYWGYKKFREPMYKPGDVANLASIKDTFDLQPADVASSTKDRIWKMPEGMDIYHLPLRLKSDESPPVLGLHGGPSIAPSKPWKMCDSVPNLYIPHARGCGKSTRPFAKFPTPGMWPGMKILEESLGIGAQVADLERIRRRLGVERISIVGHSFGGLIATMYAAEFPQHVQSLVLLAPAAVLQLPTPKGEDGDLFALVEKKIRERGNETHLEEYKAFMKQYMDFGSLPKETEESLALRQGGFGLHFIRASGGSDEYFEPPKTESIGGMACYATFLSMGIEHDYIPACKERLAGSTFPIAIVHGENDMIPPSTSRKYVDLFPPDNVTFEVLPDADHFIFDHPRTTEIVKATLART